MSDSEDIIVTLDGTDSDELVEELNDNHGRRLGIPIKAPNSGGGLFSEDDHSDRFSSSPTTTTAYSSEDDDESGSGIRGRSGSGIGGLGGLGSNSAGSSIGGLGSVILAGPGRKASLAGEVEARVFGSEAEHKAYKRLKALEEIIETERAYVKSLDIVNKFYLQPLRRILPEEAISQIFINLPTLLTVNQTLLSQLEERYLQGADCCLGDVFLTTADYLKFYTTYTIKHTDALVAVRQLKQRNATFNHFLKEMQMKPQCQNLYLTSFLIKPVQRICKYPLLIRELIKYTPDGHKDLEDLRAALDKVNSVAEHLNKHHLKAQNISKMMEIQNSLTGIGKRTLLEPRRVFKLEADLNLSKSLQRKGRRKFFLFNDLLIIAKVKKEARQKDEQPDINGSHSPRKGIYEVKVWLPIQQVLIRDIEDTPAAKHVFELWEEKDNTIAKEAKKAKSKNWVVYAKTPEEKLKWMNSIDKYKKKLFEGDEPAENGKADSKGLKMPRSKSSRQLQRGTLKMISLDTRGFDTLRRGTLNEATASQDSHKDEVDKDEGDCHRLGLSPRGRGTGSRERPKGLDLSLNGQPTPSPASSPAQLCSPGGSLGEGSPVLARTAPTSFSSSYPALPSTSWFSSSMGSSASTSLSAVASPPGSPRSSTSSGSPAHQRPRKGSSSTTPAMRRLSAALSMSPSGTPASAVVTGVGSNSTPRRFRLLNAFSPTQSSNKHDSEEEGTNDSGEDDDTGTLRRRGISFGRRSSQKRDKGKSIEAEKETDEKEREKQAGQEERSGKMKRTGSFVLLGTRLDKKNSLSTDSAAPTGIGRKRIPGTDDSDTLPAIGSGKARTRSFQEHLGSGGDHDVVAHLEG